MKCHPAVFAAIILILPLVAADYSVETRCDGECMEGRPADITLHVFYDVPAMNDRQYAFYNSTRPLQQTYVSRISVKRVALRDKLFNTTFLDMDTDLVFADRRMARNDGLDAVPLTVTASAILPKPTQISTLFFVPCFTLEYERELRQYDFFTGDYGSTYPVDVIEQCGDDVVSVHVLPKPVPACVQQDCSWHQVCDPAVGCTPSAGKIALTVLAAVLVAVIGIWSVIRRPRRRVI